MNGKQIKLFLGGYINFINAQNINCRSIAVHIDKKKFKVKCLELYNGNLDTPMIHGVSTIIAFWPLRISRFICYLRGVLWCDIAYLPKFELNYFNRFILWLFKKKSITTLEIIYDLEKTKHSNDLLKKKINLLSSFDRVYAITPFIKKNYESLGFRIEQDILYLGSELDKIKENENNIINNIIFIGNDFQRKNIEDFIKLAHCFPLISFHIVGANSNNFNIDKLIQDKNLKNINIHGTLNRNALNELLIGMNLHFLPSRIEGFPKVILETANAGVPSIVYSNYGAKDFISNRIDGYVVDHLDEVVNLIKYLLKNLNKYNNIKNHTRLLAKNFSWSIKIKKWENVFTELYKK